MSVDLRSLKPLTTTMNTSQGDRVQTIAIDSGQNGLIYMATAEKGLELEACNTSVYHVKARREEGEMPGTHVYYLLTAGNPFFARSIKSAKSESTESSNNIFFTRNDFEFSVEIPPGGRLHLLHLGLSYEWIETTLKAAIPVTAQFPSRLFSYVPVTRNCSAIEFVKAQELFEALASDVRNDMALLSRALLLLSSLLDHIPEKGEPVPDNVPPAYCQKMMLAEKIIISSIKIQLPSLKEIALRTDVSVSGLKRYFQKVFGKNVGDYYMMHKMEMAKRMLIDKNLSIEEVSGFLGYENTRQFISNFRQYFSFNPIEILKTKNIYAA